MKATIKAKSVAETRALLVGLALQAYEQLKAAKKAGRPFPKLYESGVRYRREARGHDEWRTPAECLRDGYGDCEDLTAWRTAELWMQGVHSARPDIKQVRKPRPGKPGLKHAFVRALGKKLDPSKKLGMGAKKRSK